MLKALLVDFDGTLVDSEHANAAAYALALAEYGITADVATLTSRIAGRAWRDFLPELLTGATGVEPAEVAERKRALYPSLYNLIRPSEALAGLVRASRKGGLSTALVTTASADSTRVIMARFGYDVLFDATVFGDDVTRAKPDPQGYTLAARKLGVTAAECLVIEDSSTGIEAARAFGGHVLRWTWEA